MKIFLCMIVQCVMVSVQQAPIRRRQAVIEAYRLRIEGIIGTVQSKLGSEHAVGRTQERPIPLTDVLMGMSDTMQTAISRDRLASDPPDLLIDIPRNLCKTHELYEAEPLIETGRGVGRFDPRPSLCQCRLDQPHDQRADYPWISTYR